MFSRTKRQGILAEVEVAYTQDKNQFEIVADSEGIRFSGRSGHVSSIEELDILAKTVARAWEDHMQLKQVVREKLCCNG